MRTNPNTPEVTSSLHCGEVKNLIEDDVEELKKRVEQLEACCKELREKIRPERLVPDIYRFDDELVKRLGGRV